MNIKPESKIIADDEINLYDYWKVLVKRKKILIGIFLLPLVIVTIVSLSLPRYYRGESEMTILSMPAGESRGPLIPAIHLIKFMENIDDTLKAKIFKNNPGAIKSALVSLSRKSPGSQGSVDGKVNIIVEAKTADIFPQAFEDLVEYMNNLPEVNRPLARIKEDADLKIKSLIEARKANRVTLGQITEMMEKKQITIINITPADLINKDTELHLQIKNLQAAKVAVGKLAPLPITRQPTNSQIKQSIIITGLISFFTGIFVVFFLEYIDRMKAREK